MFESLESRRLLSGSGLAGVDHGTGMIHEPNRIEYVIGKADTPTTPSPAPTHPQQPLKPQN